MFLCSITLLFYNIFIKSFDYRSIIFGSKYALVFTNNLSFDIRATLFRIQTVQFYFSVFLGFSGSICVFVMFNRCGEIFKKPFLV